MWRTATVLISITLGLITLGLIMLASTGAIHGDALFHDPYFFIKRQVAALLVGLVAACVTARIDYHFWRAAALPLALVVCLLLVLTLIPGIGVSVKGSRRWLDLGPINLQPSELAKLVSVLVVAWWMTRVQRRAADLKVGLLVPGVLLSVLAGLVLKEPDYGTTMLILCAGAATMFVGGTSPGHLAVAGALGTAGLAVLVMENAERMRRIIAFMNPEDYALDEAYQLLQSKAAFVAGGWSGVGLGHSLQKQFYLPEAHTDFIFAILGEELGLSASLGVAVLFSGLLICGLRISWKAPDMFGRLVAFGLAFLLASQAALNIGVVTGCLPTKGIPLPFISYGGTSMVVALSMIGILVNIALQQGEAAVADDLPAIKDRVHRV
jgi:cell division protein FtsW